MDELAQPLAVVCHDAGAANLIIAWLQAWPGEIRPCMQGPAAGLWARAFPDRPSLATLDEVLNGAATLLSGSGWASALEHDARVLARARGITSIAVLDHWVNYAPRFERDGRVQWPDAVWVADSHACALARQAFPGLPVHQRENLYLAAQTARIRPSPHQGCVLYVLEPTRQTWGRDTAGEFQALDYTLQHLERLLPGGVTRLLLRAHPSETADKYRAYLDRDNRVALDRSDDLAAAISQADVVVGVESFALIVALAAGRTVFSSLPPWAPPLRLPQAGIRQIRDLCAP